MYLDTANELWRCRACLHKLPAPREALETVRERIIDAGNKTVTPITHRGEIDSRARSVFYNGQDAMLRGDTPGAIAAFEAAVAIQPDFADPHLWLAKLQDDEHEKRDHLSAVLAHDPGHHEALRLLMVLNGEMTAEEAERAANAPDDVETRTVDGVRVTTKVLLCPVCGGHLTEDHVRQEVYCKFCGHQEPLKKKDIGGSALGAAMLKRRADPVRWVVGSRILRCGQCGAERTIPQNRMSMLCPFCGSNHVATQDAHGTFQQPDSVLRFTIGDEAAKDLIREKLKGVGERFAGLFDDNRVARATLEGVYLPFWVFDAYCDVTVTTTRKEPEDRRRQFYSSGPAYNSYRTSGGALGILISAVKTPPASLTDSILDFDLGQFQPYDPTLLAKFPAEIYDIDFTDASLKARSRAVQQMRDEFGKAPDQYTEVSVMASPLQMVFSLALLPVWVCSLFERDGDVRPALVNGQTGAVALGKAQKPRR